ncbi:MAG: putative sulfate exporter family transporter [Planctomycetota bacterium]
MNAQQSRGTASTAAVASGALLTLAAGLGAPAALAWGLLLRTLLRRAHVAVPAWSASAAPWLLKVGVVTLGAGLELGHVLRVGRDGFAVTLGTLALTLSLGRWLTRRLGVENDVGALVTFGTAICGGSAVAATAPALRARGEHVGIALGVVFALNAVALVLFPPLGRLLGLSPEAFGRWCAVAIHDTSSVVGAAAAFDPASLELATITKLARALWIVPVVPLAALLRTKAGGAEPAERVRIPGFILAFVAVAALRSAVPALGGLGDRVASLAPLPLALALFVTGLGLRLDGLLGRARSATVLGVLLWSASALVSLAWIQLR